MRLALAGDTMLGRGVATRLATEPPTSVVSPEVAEACRDADLTILNLECCISARGEPWADPTKPFFFRAPPRAVETLIDLGVTCVTLANNHALDFGEEALVDTLALLDAAGIRHAGAGPDVQAAREPAVLEDGSLKLGVVGLADHPADFAASPTRAGIAFADLRSGVPGWVTETIGHVGADLVLVTPHWGPNMTSEPVGHVREAARAFVDAGASLVAGHSAHVFQGVAGRVLYDLGDFLDDYAVDPELRNDLGLLWLVELGAGGPARLEVVPLKLDHCFTRVADGEDAAWIRRRFTEANAAMGTELTEEDGRLVVSLG